MANRAIADGERIRKKLDKPLTAENVISSVDDALAEEANRLSELRAADERLYCMILARADSPAATDASDLAAMIADGFVTRKMLTKHFAAVADLRKQIELHNDRQAATKRTKDAVEKRDALRKKHEAEMTQAERELFAARGHTALCHGAAREIAVIVGSCAHFKGGGLLDLLGYRGPGDNR